MGLKLLFITDKMIEDGMLSTAIEILKTLLKYPDSYLRTLIKISIEELEQMRDEE